MCFYGESAACQCNLSQGRLHLKCTKEEIVSTCLAANPKLMRCRTSSLWKMLKFGHDFVQSNVICEETTVLTGIFQVLYQRPHFKLTITMSLKQPKGCSKSTIFITASRNQTQYNRYKSAHEPVGSVWLRPSAFKEWRLALLIR